MRYTDCQMKYLVAVSGGVDSVVLLDMLSNTEHTLIVAHVDHGIRDDSTADARFVAALAQNYHVPFISCRLELGKEASEDAARQARYDFLYQQAAEHGALIATAHHLGDMAETVAINLHRGTGWRGLAVLSREGLVRPLISLTKQQLYEYAVKHHLEWVEDSTNRDMRYLRNRVRRTLTQHSELLQPLSALRARQLQLRRDITSELRRLVGNHGGSRYFLTHIPHSVAIELLGEHFQQMTGERPTRPQLERALVAVKTAKPGTTSHVGSRISLHFTPRNYEVKRV